MRLQNTKYVFETLIRDHYILYTFFYIPYFMQKFKLNLIIQYKFDDN